MNCTGHCCTKFFLKEEVTERLLDEPEYYKDGVQIQQMLLPTGVESHWTCVNFDRETRQCGVYENRPHICTEHPRSRECPYEGCTLSGDELEPYKALWDKS